MPTVNRFNTVLRKSGRLNLHVPPINFVKYFLVMFTTFIASLIKSPNLQSSLKECRINTSTGNHKIIQRNFIYKRNGIYINSDVAQKSLTALREPHKIRPSPGQYYYCHNSVNCPQETAVNCRMRVYAVYKLSLYSLCFN
jgi:hypothetical protein